MLKKKGQSFKGHHHDLLNTLHIRFTIKDDGLSLCAWV